MENQKVEVVNVNIPFFSLIMLLAKTAIAAIPAFILVCIFWSIVIGFIGNFAGQF